jgi:hypothetical protein
MKAISERLKQHNFVLCAGELLYKLIEQEKAG